MPKKIACAEVKKYQMKPLPAGDVSFQFNRCRVRCLDPNRWTELPLKACGNHFPNAEEGEYVRNLPIGYCDGLTGFFAKDVAMEIRPKVDALNDIKDDYCGQKGQALQSLQ